MEKYVSAKLHGIRVTGSKLNYHGSITIDAEFCRAVGIKPLEYVDIWNKMSGDRISTYVIYGDPGSRCCILNGAAARTCQEGDEIIIASSVFGEVQDIIQRNPQVLVFGENNEVVDHLSYEVFYDEQGLLNMRVAGARHAEAYGFPQSLTRNA